LQIYAKRLHYSVQRGMIQSPPKFTQLKPRGTRYEYFFCILFTFSRYRYNSKFITILLLLLFSENRCLVLRRRNPRTTRRCQHILHAGFGLRQVPMCPFSAAPAMLSAAPRFVMLWPGSAKR